MLHKLSHSTILFAICAVIVIMSLVAVQETQAQRWGWYNGYYPYPRGQRGFYGPGRFGVPYYHGGRYYNRLG
ncbi:hypothetical protein DdX_05125 [Ditylenchus destructor]|uniref:Uncharacterized protein n=1 Tax=Ditylenchus destructor TaxID=166010 RepID=A0AAD4NAR5_9BILA|nr:hypothetical protein DdX_05125 [Ditylenchus destructor]